MRTKNGFEEAEFDKIPGVDAGNPNQHSDEEEQANTKERTYTSAVSGDIMTTTSTTQKRIQSVDTIWNSS